MGELTGATGAGAETAERAAPAELVLDLAEMATRHVNAALRSLPDGARARLVNPAGRHNLAVGLTRAVRVTIAGPAGYYVGGLGEAAEVTVDGPVGWGAGENLMSGTVRVRGAASQSAAASAHGGLVVVEGDASLRAGISLKGGRLAVAGDVGRYCAFLAQAGTILVGGDAGEALGDSLYEAVIYVAGRVRSLGTDARICDLTAADVAAVRVLAAQAGFDHVDPENVTRVASARRLYHFDTAHHGAY
ncbi:MULTISPECIES: glutamate synthase [Frankia]|uniref:glutamate synthase n=1 Tax=Frankia TaxID=1854 RepID=UPI0003195A0A|nr:MULTISPECIES: glutamate synthase [Frankia]